MKKLYILKIVEKKDFFKIVTLLIFIIAEFQSDIKITSNLKFYWKSKLISIRYFKSKKLVKDRSILFESVSTQEMLTDWPTKLDFEIKC